MITLSIYNKAEHKEKDFINKWIKLPATREEMEEHLKDIEIEDNDYKDVGVAYHKFDLSGIESLSRCKNIEEKNYLAKLLTEMGPDELEKFEAAAIFGDNSNSTAELINLTFNLDCYKLYPVDNYEELGECIAEETNIKRAMSYTDYEELGKDYAKTVNGKFNDMGYVIRNDKDFVIKYNGQNLPHERKILTPQDPQKKIPIKKQLEIYEQIKENQPQKKTQANTRNERE